VPLPVRYQHGGQAARAGRRDLLGPGLHAARAAWRGGHPGLRLHPHPDRPAPDRSQPGKPQAGGAGPADGGGGGPGGRGDLHRQVRPREGAVPLGPLRQEEREEQCWVRVSSPLGRQELGASISGAAHRAGGGGRLPRRRPRPAADHRPRLQRRADAAVGAAGQHATQSGVLSRSSKGGAYGNANALRFEDKKGSRTGLAARREEPGHRGRERRDALGRARPHEDHRSRRDQPHQARPHRDG
jgi:hypothetical protein